MCQLVSINRSHYDIISKSIREDETTRVDGGSLVHFCMMWSVTYNNSTLTRVHCDTTWGKLGHVIGVLWYRLEYMPSCQPVSKQGTTWERKKWGTTCCGYDLTSIP